MTTAADINSTKFPRDKRLAEIEEKLKGEYVGGMTEYWQRQRNFLLTQKGQEIIDALDEADIHVTDPSHGGKVTCHKCGGFVTQKEYFPYYEFSEEEKKVIACFHDRCYNRYEHYYGLDKPID